MDYYEIVIKAVIDNYKEIKECMAIALIGSRARGTERPLSNVNLMIVSNILPDISKRREIAQSLAGAGTGSQCHSSPIPQDSFSRRGLNIKIWHILSDIICDRVSDIEKKRHVTNQLLLSSLFDSKILWDPTQQLHAWKTQINPIPEGYLGKIIPEIYSEVTSVIVDLSMKKQMQNHFYFNVEIIEALKNLYELIFLLNRKFLNFTSRINESLEYFDYVPENFTQRVDDLICLSGDSRSAQSKIKILGELAISVGSILYDTSQYNVNSYVDQIRRHCE